MSWRERHLWWQRGVFYEIYLRSFQDTTGNGCGDLAGVIGRLDYLEWLGVDAVWLTPMYPSPMKDFGYDVTDYVGVDPRFGTLNDIERLVEQANRRGLRIILDLVPNHTSNEHPWFIASRASRDDPKRDWYIWADPAPGGGPPNNWLAEFGGSAWEYDERTGQYYYHAFLPEQPDLNWRNPAVRQAMFDVMRFWLDRGIDGFRVDVMWHLIKDAELRPNPPNPDYDPSRDSPYTAVIPVWSTDQPDIHEVVAEMRAVLDEYEDRVMIGEVYLPIDELVSYYGEDLSGAHLPFNFELIFAPWDAAHVRQLVDRYEASLPEGGWPNWVLGNHDQPRVATRIGSGPARAAAVLLLTLRGTPTMYYGDEIGMRDVHIRPEDAVDPRELRCPGRGLGRDPERTPMQWSSEPGAGFTMGKAWLPIGGDHATVNVERQREEPRSMLSLHRRLLALRAKQPALAIGDYRPIDTDADLYAYVRSSDEGPSFLVAINFAPEKRPLAARAPWPSGGEIVVSTVEVDPAGARFEQRRTLRPHEAIVVRLDSPLHSIR